MDFSDNELLTLIKILENILKISKQMDLSILEAKNYLELI